MNNLYKTIHSLKKEEIRYYKLFAKKSHAINQRKDIELFNLMYSNKERYNDKIACQKLYNGNKNNFYQLKSNLLENLNKSLIIQHAKKEKDIEIFNYISLARIQKRKRNLNLAFHYLKKAEKKALRAEKFEILAIIYNEILKLAYNLISIDVDKYVNKKKNNKKKLDLAHDIDIVLAPVMHKIKTTQNLDSTNDKILSNLNNHLDILFHKNDIPNTPTFRIQIFKVISRELLQKKEFIALEKYLKSILKKFKKEKIFNKNNHEQKLMLLTYLTNSLYENQKLEESLDFAKKLKKAMNEHNRILYDNYLFYYYNALVINYSKLDYSKALKVLNEAKNNKKIQELPTFSAFIYLNMGLIYYSQKKYKMSIKNISRLILQQDFLNLSKSFQLKILITEIQVRFHLNQSDLIEEKIKILHRKYSRILNNNTRDKKIIEIIKSLIYCTNTNLDKNLQQKINELKKTYNKEKDIINYNEWVLNI